MKRATDSAALSGGISLISIHALVKRATVYTYSKGVVPSISIHALVKRATFLFLRDSLFQCHFNPRPREEGDPAPARGSAKPNDFNPRPREEGDRR